MRNEAFKMSLRTKLFALISGLIAFYVLLSWLSNSLLLDKYYFYNKKNTLMESYRELDKAYKGDPEEIIPELERIETDKGLMVIILDKNHNMKYNSRPRTREVRQRPNEASHISDNQNSFENLIKSRLDKTQPGQAIIESENDGRANSNVIRLLSILNNGDYLFITTPLAAIKESADIANKFFLFSGLITLILGSIVIFIAAGRFTRPILVLNKIANSIAALDFSKRYSVKTDDEIGQLGESINSISEQMQKHILQLQKDIEKERKIDEMRKEFISNVSHELKTPITVIQGYTEGLKVNINKDEERRNFYCDVIMDETLKMNKLVQQLLELSQLESGGIKLERQSFNMYKLIEKVVEKNSLVFKEKDSDITIESEEGLYVNADYDRIEQVLNNYINNAVNHLDENKKIKISLIKDGKKARVSVYNSGQHIPENSLDKIWLSFYKVDKARTRAYGGTGLGLSIVRAIQEEHGNRYGVGNVEGGVEFWFELDLVQL